jgi:hypothetical protein
MNDLFECGIFPKIVAEKNGTLFPCLPHYGKSKGKAIQLQAWTGPEGTRRLRLTYFKTFGT